MAAPGSRRAAGSRRNTRRRREMQGACSWAGRAVAGHQARTSRSAGRAAPRVRGAPIAAGLPSAAARLGPPAPVLPTLAVGPAVAPVPVLPGLAAVPLRQAPAVISAVVVPAVWHRYQAREPGRNSSSFAQMPHGRTRCPTNARRCYPPCSPPSPEPVFFPSLSTRSTPFNEKILTKTTITALAPINGAFLGRYGPTQK